MGRPLKSVTGDPDDAPVGKREPAPLEPGMSRCTRCRRDVKPPEGSKEPVQRWVICQDCIQQEHESLLQLQLDMAAGKEPRRRYWINGQWIEEYANPEQEEKDVTPVSKALPPVEAGPSDRPF